MDSPGLNSRSRKPPRDRSPTRVDVRFGDGNRWVEVAPPGAGTPIAICPHGPNVTAGGKETGISLQTSARTSSERITENGTSIAAMKARVRQKEHLDEGQTVTVHLAAGT